MAASTGFLEQVYSYGNSSLRFGITQLSPKTGISNADTPSYHRQVATLAELAPNANTAFSVGNGVEITGLTRAVIRRCKYLIDLPQVYREQVLSELGKPKSQQKLTEDFFIEMERALKTVERAMPDAIDNKDRVRRVLIEDQHGR